MKIDRVEVEFGMLRTKPGSYNNERHVERGGAMSASKNDTIRPQCDIDTILNRISEKDDSGGGINDYERGVQDALQWMMGSDVISSDDFAGDCDENE